MYRKVNWPNLLSILFKADKLDFTAIRARWEEHKASYWRKGLHLAQDKRARF